MKLGDFSTEELMEEIDRRKKLDRKNYHEDIRLRNEAIKYDFKRGMGTLEIAKKYGVTASLVNMKLYYERRKAQK
jgi:DNA-binding transcriptional regulator LsrR (DeoR family)